MCFDSWVRWTAIFLKLERVKCTCKCIPRLRLPSSSQLCHSVAPELLFQLVLCFTCNVPVVQFQLMRDVEFSVLKPQTEGFKASLTERLCLLLTSQLARTALKVSRKKLTALRLRIFRATVRARLQRMSPTARDKELQRCVLVVQQQHPELPSVHSTTKHAAKNYGAGTFTTNCMSGRCVLKSDGWTKCSLLLPAKFVFFFLTRGLFLWMDVPTQ